MEEYDFFINYREKFKLEHMKCKIRDFNNAQDIYRRKNYNKVNPSIDYQKFYENILSYDLNYIPVLYQESIIEKKSWGIYPSLDLWTDVNTYFGLLVFKDRIEVYHRLNNRQCNICFKTYQENIYIDVFIDNMLKSQFDINWLPDDPKEVCFCAEILESDYFRDTLIDCGVYYNDYQHIIKMLRAFYDNPREIFYHSHEFVTTMIYYLNNNNASEIII